jgi:putative transposase
MCEILNISKSGYYSWLRRPKSLRSMENEKLLEKIELEYIKSRRLYGVRRVTATLNKGGFAYGHNRVAKLMQENGIRSLRKRGRRVNTTDSRHEYPIAPNLLGRGYKTTMPHHVWVSDLTYIPTGEGWLYLAAVEDICLKKVV